MLSNGIVRSIFCKYLGKFSLVFIHCLRTGGWVTINLFWDWTYQSESNQPYSLERQYVLNKHPIFLSSHEVINILKCKIAESLSFQLSLIIKHPKYTPFEGFQLSSNLRFSSRAFGISMFPNHRWKMVNRMCDVCLKKKKWLIKLFFFIGQRSAMADRRGF